MTQQQTTPQQLFEQASRTKLRFESNRGVLSVEDLWDLPLTTTKAGPSLDTLARAYHAKIATSTPISFVGDTTPSKAAAQDALAFDLIKHVIDVKQAENAAAAAATAKRAQKARILELIGKKQDAELESKSEAELQALLDTL